MKKHTFITITISSIVLLGIMISLCVGKAKKIEIEDVNGKSTLIIAKGELLGTGYSIKAPIDADLESLMLNSHDALNYINENILNKGYSNDKAIQKITNYMNSINGKVNSVEDHGYVFSGLNWINQKLSNTK